MKDHARSVTLLFDKVINLPETEKILSPGSDLLGWCTNTSVFQQWADGLSEPRLLWYSPDAHDQDESFRFQKTHFATLFSLYWLSKRHTSKRIPYKVLYTKWASQDFDELSIMKSFQSLISQELTVTDDIAKSILRLSNADQQALMDLFLYDSPLSIDVLKLLLRSCIALRKGGSDPERVFDTVIVVDRQANLANESSWIKFMLEMMRAPAMGQASFVSIGRKTESTKMLWGKCLLDAYSESQGTSWPLVNFQTSTRADSFLDCLSSLKFNSWLLRRDQVADAEPGTNQWIWGYQPYLHWEQQSSGIFWIQGKAGSGKSVLAKSIVNNVKNIRQYAESNSYMSRHSSRTPSDSKVLFADWFYSRRGGLHSISHAYMLRSILFQLLEQDPQLFKYYKKIYQGSSWTDWHTSLPIVFHELAQAGNHIPRIVSIIDGVDEAASAEGRGDSRLNQERMSLVGMLDLLSDLVEVPGSRIKFIILSRLHPSIERALSRYDKVILEGMNEGDIKKIVEANVRLLEKAMESGDDDTSKRLLKQRPGSARSRQSRIHTSVSKSTRMFSETKARKSQELSEIKAYLIMHARGIILWVTTINRELLKRVCKNTFTYEELKAELKKLPKEIGAMYNLIVKELSASHDPEDIIKARRVFTWVMATTETKPMTAIELFEVLAIPIDLEDALGSTSDPISSGRMAIESWKQFRRGLYDLCGPFVEIISPVPRASELPLEDVEIEPFFIIQLIHQTAKDFLASDEASVFRTTVESAVLAVEQDKIRYLQVAFPTCPTAYTPSFKANEESWEDTLERLVAFVDDRLLFGHIRATLSEELLIRFFPADECAPGIISPLLQIRPYEIADPIKTVQRSLVGRYCWLVCSLGFTTAAENLLKIGSLINGWWEHYEIAIMSAAFLAATQHEVLEVLRLFLPRERRHTFYRDLHRCAAAVAQKTHDATATRECKGKSRSHDLPQDALPGNQWRNSEVDDESNTNTHSSRSWAYGAMTDPAWSRESVRLKKYHSYEYDDHDSAAKKEILLKVVLFEQERLSVKNASKEIQKYLDRPGAERADQAGIVEAVQMIVECGVARRGAYIDPEGLIPFREPAQSNHGGAYIDLENLIPFMGPAQSNHRDAAVPSPESLD